MFEDYGMICFAVKKCSQIKGRKKFHKMIYLSKEFNIPFQETFEWNMFGPYSKELSAEINSLCQMKFLIEEQNREEYFYSLSEKGESFLDNILEKLNTKYGESGLNKFEKILRILNEYNSKELEKISSVNFLIKKGYDEEYIKSFLNYSKKYTEQDVISGKDLFNELLIKVND